MNDRIESQAQNLNSPEKIRIFLQTFKTVKCNKPDCVFRKDVGGVASPFHDIKQCCFYHDQSDFRRSPFIPQNSKQLLYSNFPIEMDSNGCRNDMEYLYHPLNYQRNECVNHRPNRKLKCTAKYCPYYHQNTERLNVKILLQNLNKNDVFSKIQEYLQSIGEYSGKYLQALAEDRKLSKSNRKLQLYSPEVTDTLKPSDIIVKSPLPVIEEKVSDEKDSKKITDFGKKSMRAPFKQRRKDSSANMWILKKKEPTIWKNGYWVNGHGKHSRKLTLQDVQNSDELHYYMGQEVDMFEDINNEFKNFNSLDVKTAANYICGFLNSFGGQLFFGIDNDGFVKGIFLSR